MPRNYTVRKLPRIRPAELALLLERVAEIRITGSLKERQVVQYEFDFKDSRRRAGVRGKKRD